MSNHACFYPDADGPWEWVCPECERIWDRHEDRIEDTPDGDLIEAWYEPRDEEGGGSIDHVTTTFSNGLIASIPISDMPAVRHGEEFTVRFTTEVTA